MQVFIVGSLHVATVTEQIYQGSEIQLVIGRYM